MPGTPASRAALRIAPLIGLLAALLWGCTKNGPLRPNAPPETTLFVQIPRDTVDHTVNHVVHLYWFGSDPDGYVLGYQIRFKNLPAPADTDTAWVSTARTDSLFTIFTPTGLSTPRFEVRAVDDKGIVDPTPAFQDSFRFSNQAPLITLLGSPRPLPDTTFASATLSWSANDPDGHLAPIAFRLWLDGHDATPHLLSRDVTTFTLPSADFAGGPGDHSSGQRTVFLQAIDDGGLLSAPVSFSWYVKPPVLGQVARLLLIDDVPSTVPNPAQYDTLYQNMAARAFTEPGHNRDEYAILDLERFNPFRSAKDLEQTLRLYRAVIWYREGNLQLSSLLQSYQGGLEDYLESPEGHLYLSGLNLVTGQGSNGSLTEDFAFDFLGSDYLYRAPISGRPDSTVSWTMRGTRLFRSDRYADSLRVGISISGLRCFALRDPAWGLFTAAAGTLQEGNPVTMPVAVRVPQSGGGVAIVFTFPVAATNAFPLGSNGYRNASRVLRTVLDDLGVFLP